MGREIRKVPQGWEHPQKEHGAYQPMLDSNYEQAVQEWIKNHFLWLEKKHPDQLNPERILSKECRYFAEYAGDPPLVEYHRKYEDKDCVCFQVYETVSEGTPVSPVFESLKEIEDWLVEQGYSRTSAQKFCNIGFAPSLVFNSRGFQDGITAYDSEV